MFRYNLNINYGCIEEMAVQSDNLHSALNKLISAVDRISNVVDANKGLAADELKSKSPEITDKIAKIDVGVQKSAYLLRDFKDTMTGIIAPLTEGADLRVNVNDSMNKCKMMSYDLQEMVNYVSGLNADVGGSLLPVDISSDKYAQMQEANKELDMIKEQLISIAKNIYSTYSDDIEKYRKIIEEYGQADSDFESQAQTLYYDYADVGFWQTTTGKVIICAGLVAGCILLIVLAPEIAALATTAGTAIVSSSALASLGLTFSVEASTVAGIGISGLAAGGVELLFGTIDSTINKTDMETAMLGSLQDGIIVGTIASVVGGGANVAATKTVDKLVTKVPQYSRQITKYAPIATEYVANVVGDTAGNVVNNVVNGEGAQFGKTLVTEMGNGVIDVGGEKIKGEVIEKVQEIDRNDAISKVYNKGGKIALDYVEDEVKEAYQSVVEDVFKGKEISAPEVFILDDKEIESSHIERFTPENISLEDVLQNQIEKIARHRRH